MTGLRALPITVVSVQYRTANTSMADNAMTWVLLRRPSREIRDDTSGYCSARDGAIDPNNQQRGK